jgi:hypothetical protein
MIKAKTLLQGRQIFKFGSFRKNDTKKLKNQLVFHPKIIAFFPPYYSYTNPLPIMLKKKLSIW